MSGPETQRGYFEKEILDTIHYYESQGNRKQADLYTWWLSDLYLRKNSGLIDLPYHVKPDRDRVELYAGLSGKELDLANKYRCVFGELDDSMLVASAEHFFSLQQNQFSRPEKMLVALGFSRSLLALQKDNERASKVNTPLERVRSLSPVNLVQSGQIVYSRALVFLNGIQHS